MAQKKKVKTKLQKQKALEKEADELFVHIINEDVGTLMEKVGWILNHYPTARDSDVTCQIKYWQQYEPEVISNDSVKISDLYNHARLTSIARARAKIQNEYKLFLASEEVRKHRGKLEEDYQDWAVGTQADYPLFSVYVDESGKDGKYLILGSMWVVDDISSVTLMREIMDLKSRTHYDQEIHFASIDNAKEGIYKQLIDLLYDHSSSFCFKYLIVDREGNRNIQEALKIMLYHLLLDGVKHENSSGRAPLPRSLQVVKDLESKGSDKILLKEIKDRLQIANNTVLDKKLFLGEFKAIDSKESIQLQIADIYTSSLNRILNEKSEQIRAKDRIAKYMLEKFSILIDGSSIASMSDISSEMPM